MNEKITILGAGSTGMATAAVLGLEGVAVTLCDLSEHTGDFDAIRRQGGILLRGGSGKTGCVMPEVLTNDFALALEEADRVLVCTSAARHTEVAKLIAPHARPGQSYLFSPGNFGSFALGRELEAAGKEGVVIGELSGNLWACRRTAPGEVLVATPLKGRVKAAALPARDTPRLLQAFQGILPLEEGKNVLEVSLNSPNVVSHVGGAVLCAVQIERKGKDFAFFLDGLGEVTLRCFATLEQERNAVLGRLGLRVYNPSSEGFMRTLMDRDSHHELDYFRALDGPCDFSHRYVSEDAACGVAMLVSLGKEYGVPTPLTQAFLTVAGAINSIDYLREGRTLEKLRLDGLSDRELMERLS